MLQMMQCAVDSTALRTATSDTGNVYSNILPWLAAHPAAQCIDTEYLAYLLDKAISNGAASVDFLLGLPAAKGLSAGRLLQLCSRAALGNTAGAAGELIRWDLLCGLH